jgi:hypothetical protein
MKAVINHLAKTAFIVGLTSYFLLPFDVGVMVADAGAVGNRDDVVVWNGGTGRDTGKAN